MKAVLFLTVLLSGILAITAAAVEAVEPEQVPLELQEENQVAEIEVEVAAPEVEALEKSVEMPLSVEGRFYTCPTGWAKYKSSCYLYVSTTLAWSSAVANCNNMGATLASAKNVFDYSFLQDLTSRAGSTHAWIGGFYFQGWRWVDQSTFSYSYWSTQLSATSYPCIYLNSRAGWSNQNCNGGRPSICMTKSDNC